MSQIIYLCQMHFRPPRIKGGKGGKAKSDKYVPLKEYVIEQYIAQHSHKSNRHAAQLIEKSCPSELLLDQSQHASAPLLKNPAVRFAVWIGEYKQENAPK